MGRLVYAAICSLDGFVADADGRFDWSMPSEEVHAHLNDQDRGVRTRLLGRRMYDVLRVWDTLDDAEPVITDFAALWRGSDKIVYSRSLDAVGDRARIVREFDPEDVRRWKAETDADLEVGGPELAALALRAGLVDEYRCYLNPVIIGSGTAALPAGLRLDLQLTDERRFANGVIFARYAVRS